MKFKLLICTCACFIFLSCSKDETQRPDNQVKLLKKMIITDTNGGVSETDSLMFYYDANNRLIKRVTGLDNGVFYESNITRNTGGIITGFDFSDGASVVHYDPVTSRYISSVTTRTANVSTDSAVFIYYDDKISEKLHYLKAPAAGSYELKWKDTFAYDGNNNVLIQKHYTYNTGSWVLDDTKTSSYDNKVSAITLGNESIILAPAEFANWEGKNNRLTFSATRFGDSETATYNYDSDDQPVTSTANEGGGEVTEIDYLYY